MIRSNKSTRVEENQKTNKHKWEEFVDKVNVKFEKYVYSNSFRNVNPHTKRQSDMGIASLSVDLEKVGGSWDLLEHEEKETAEERV